MNNNMKKGLSLILAIAMICSIFVTIVIPTQAATYVYNWGQREVDCTQLSTYAQAFYTGSYVFEEMSKLQGGSSQSNAPSSALYKALQTLMKSKHTYVNGYSANNSLLAYTDCQNGGGKISSFYSGKEIGPGWDSAATWNKEHTWPNSKGLEGSDEDDVMMIRPTSVSENSSRGNTAYGKSSGYYNPNNESGGKYDLRGDVARICLYVYTRWGNTGKMWGSSGVMESLDVLLEWMEADPVDTWEMGRNDSVQSITGTRNVFVDYPEYAFLLFGKDVPADYVSPSNNKGTPGNPGSGSGSGNSGNSGTTTTPVVIPESAKLQCGSAYVTANATSYTSSSSGTTKQQLGMTSDKSAAATWTIVKNSDGSYSFTTGGKYLSADGTHVKLVTAQDANTKFEFEEANGGVFIKCQSATYQSKPQYLEVYRENLTVYGMGSDTSIYTFAFADAQGGTTGGGNTGSGNEGSGNEGSGNTGGGNTTVGEKVTYTFKDYDAGDQYASNETHVLDDVMTVVTDDAHFTTEIRLYHTVSEQYGSHHGTAVFKSTRAIKGFAVNAGKNADVLKVSGSNDGQNWTVIQEITVASSFADYTVDMNGAEYTYIKLESTAKQIRVAYVNVEYAATTTPGGDNSEETTGAPTTETTEAPTTETTEAPTTETTEAPTTETTEAPTTETTEAPTTETTEAPTTETTEAPTTETTEAPTAETTEAPTTETTEAPTTETTEAPTTETTEAPTTSATEDAETESSDEDILSGIDLNAIGGCGSSLGGSAVIIAISLAGVMLFKKKREE